MSKIIKYSKICQIRISYQPYDWQMCTCIKASYIRKKYASWQAECCNWPLTPYNFISAMLLYNPNDQA